jgi:lipoate-protein ligase A
VVALATRAGSRSAVGSVLAPRLVIADDLYDYASIRRSEHATMFVARTERPTLVLGGSQPLEVLNPDTIVDTPVRRRRGGGGLVLLRPEDLWIDWWIPREDERWNYDVHVSSVRVGKWWAEVLATQVAGVQVHEGPLEGDHAYRVVCFAGRGPGEVFVDGRKAVGVTQWRVREGVFVSTVLHAEPTADVVAYLKAAPPGLADALDHHTLSTLRSVDAASIVTQLRALSAPSDRIDVIINSSINS